MDNFEEVRHYQQEPSLGEGRIISGWRSIEDIQKAVEGNAKSGMSTILDFCGRPSLLSTEEARAVTRMQVAAEQMGVRVGIINVNPSDQALLAKCDVRYKLANSEAAKMQLIIDDAIDRVLQKIKSIRIDDESLRSLIQEEVSEDLTDDVFELILTSRRAYVAYNDVIAAYALSVKEDSEQDENVLPTDMVTLNKMLRRFGKYPDQR